jgi:molybdopterin molybdotransferase
VFVRPALLAMQGRRVTRRPRLTLPAATSWRTPEDGGSICPRSSTPRATAGAYDRRRRADRDRTSRAASGSRAPRRRPADVAEVHEGDPVMVHLLEGWDA